MNKSIRIFFLFFCSGVLFSCNNNAKLSEKDFIDVMVDFYIVDAIAKQKPSNSTNKKEQADLKMSILQKYGTNKTELDNTLRWYADNVDQYTAVQEKIIEVLDNKSKVQTQLLADLYTYRYAPFVNVLPKNFKLDEAISVFSFKMDSTYIQDHPASEYKLKFNALNVDTTYQQLLSEIYYNLSDTTIVAKSVNIANGLNEIYTPLDSIDIKKLKCLTGFIRLEYKKNDKPALILNNIEILTVK